MLTIRAEIKKQEQKLDGTYNVKLRFTLDRKVKRLSTSLFVTNKDLPKDLKIKQTSPIKQEVDSLIRSYQEKCAKLKIEPNHYTLDEVMDYLDGERQKQQTIDFIKFSREWIASTTIKGASNYTSALNALIRFIGKEELDVNLITLDFLEKFKAFLNKEREERTKKLIAQGKRVPSNRSLSLYLVSIKKLFNEAKKKYNKKDKNLILIPNSPFEDFIIPKQEATRKRAIPADIIKKVWKLPYKDMRKGYGRVNQQVQHYEKALKKHSAGVRKLSFSLGLVLIFFLILAIFPSVTVPMSVPLSIYCLTNLFPFSMVPFCHAQYESVKNTGT